MVICNTTRKAIELLKRMLEKDPKERFSAEKALNHIFISKSNIPKMQQDDELDPDYMPDNDNFSAFENMKKF
jgi:serine/threonine protein kinase